jgi:hypothetical protein
MSSKVILFALFHLGVHHLCPSLVLSFLGNKGMKNFQVLSSMPIGFVFDHN